MNKLTKTTIKMKETKELKNLKKAIQAYIEKHNYDCNVIVSVCGFDENQDVVDDWMVLCGDDETMRISYEQVGKELEEYYCNLLK
jgi:uncharacterized protein YecT (DUF1311 family)